MTYNGEADNINTLNHDILIIFLQKGMKKTQTQWMKKKIYRGEGVHTFRIYDRLMVTDSSLLYLPHHIYQQSFREHHPDFSDLC